MSRNQRTQELFPHPDVYGRSATNNAAANNTDWKHWDTAQVKHWDTAQVKMILARQSPSTVPLYQAAKHTLSDLSGYLVIRIPPHSYPSPFVSLPIHIPPHSYATAVVWRRSSHNFSEVSVGVDGAATTNTSNDTAHLRWQFHKPVGMRICSQNPSNNSLRLTTFLQTTRSPWRIAAADRGSEWTGLMRGKVIRASSHFLMDCTSYHDWTSLVIDQSSTSCVLHHCPTESSHLQDKYWHHVFLTWANWRWVYVV